jgi:hypothetical protein
MNSIRQKLGFDGILSGVIIAVGMQNGEESVLEGCFLGSDYRVATTPSNGPRKLIREFQGTIFNDNVNI